MRNGSVHKRNARTMSRAVRYSRARQASSELRETVDAVSSVLKDLPPADNAAGAVDKMLRANAILRNWIRSGVSASAFWLLVGEFAVSSAISAYRANATVAIM